MLNHLYKEQGFGPPQTCEIRGCVSHLYNEGGMQRPRIHSCSSCHWSWDGLPFLPLHLRACEDSFEFMGTWEESLWCLILFGFVVLWFFFSFFYAGLYPMKSPSFTLIAVGNMWSLIKNIFSVEIAFISWANFSWPSTHQSFFGKGNSSLWVSKCQATEQNEREGEGGKNNSQVCCKAFVQKVLEGFLFSP